MADEKKTGTDLSPEMKLAIAEAEQRRARNTVKFGKPFEFEHKEYSEIDLGGMDRMTIADAVEIQKRLFGQQEVASSLVCETTTAFAMEVAAMASGMPIEFFKLMPIDSGRRVRRAVQAYINRKNRGGKNVLRLEAPYLFKGEQYEEFDLSAIAEMSVMNESAAENAMAREGFVITENTFNYLYACIIAGMAVNKPKELFTGLPLYELLKLKEVVNSVDFFE